MPVKPLLATHSEFAAVGPCPFTAAAPDTVGTATIVIVGLPCANAAESESATCRLVSGFTPVFRTSTVKGTSNAAGPTTVDIPLTLRAEFYQSAAAGFVRNNDDNCTPLAAGNFKLSNHNGSLSGTDVSVSVPAALTSGVANGMKLVKSTAPVSGPGSVRVCFDLDSAPGAGDTSCASSTSANHSFLQGPWSSAGSYDRDPAAQVNVGTFGAQPNNLIYFRENY